ncbi:DUF6084 family protein [soil metagenome]
MPDLAFDVVAAEPDHYGATPTMLFKLRIVETSGDPVHTMALRTQIQINAQMRSYDDAERVKLGGLFGQRERWGDTLRPSHWMTGSTMVPGFRSATEIDVAAPCSYDFDVAADQYMMGLDDGVIPLSLLFSGTVISRGATGYSVTQIPWHKEATYPLPVATWKALVDAYYPGTAWIRVRRDTFDRLARRRTARGDTDWDTVLADVVEPTT